MKRTETGLKRADTPAGVSGANSNTLITILILLIDLEPHFENKYDSSQTILSIKQPL
jgi:hypothetical protein